MGLCIKVKVCAGLVPAGLVPGLVVVAAPPPMDEPARAVSQLAHLLGSSEQGGGRVPGTACGQGGAGMFELQKTHVTQACGETVCGNWERVCACGAGVTVLN